ncbi:glycosyltransferase family 2 protein [Arthrobacter sp. RT-1]|jgi:biofilm PGA synthesis N-glycosyltransferase PgaC|uniref:glycosyltransferase n=1 Tax=Arthrobacter sp. RT-1 TaxID=2292263 RepID=UPI000E1F3632|nr:glycosyltransferase family 2 protein [Arthrobacter sp. RT-1]RDV08312.1 glycosyltransferase family 2 protein [Arthrobacter sp. RT-1]
MTTTNDAVVNLGNDRSESPLAQATDKLRPPARVIAIIPAHNEEIGIAQTIDSLRRQTQAPDRILVAADNCTDGTVDIARAMGVEVLETRDNTARKAGALNQGLAMVLPALLPHDVVLMMDADSRLNHDFVSAGMAYFECWPLRGGISGSYVAADHPSRVALLQKIEYTQGLRTVHRRAGRIHVLSGAATMFTVESLRKVAGMRGSTLIPGVKGLVYDESSLTEDYELTVALKRVGYDPRCAIDCVVVTDVMPTWHDWMVQRLRWQRGTLETLFTYGFVEHTRKAWAVQAWTYFRSVIPLLMLMTWGYALAFEGVAFYPFWLLIIPVFMLDQLVATWNAGWRARIYATLIIPLWIYETYQSVAYWQALRLALRGGEKEWLT